MVTTRQRLTFEDWLAMPDDGRRYELLNGELIEMAPPTANHQLIVGALHEWLLRARRAGYGTPMFAPVAVLLDATMRRENALHPDIFFIRRGRERIITATAVEGVPDLVIEILSPTNQETDLRGGDKWKAYQRAAVPHYWIVDPSARAVVQYVFTQGELREAAERRPGEELASPLFPGITLPVAELFADLRDEG